ncbi:hypothetical protein LYSHEL_26720 [Lysobacter helvus]|uniref:Uncharacterized protein n=2 Tax=Lysobacteraceae TaxID=32033 RepID=A0ABN6G118_9GAMM|nr:MULTISPECIES: hypothetical protein [Lysobacter]BCT93647.1 hypothetical protein LYSCAS_26710 [Lysobacter caseinilyticus]BCT96801.1 hypothetical protein LYSHEL_26720 [Lysobacter helvus]
MKTLTIACCLFLLAGVVHADGLPKAGRYVGKVLVFDLTDDQKHEIAHFRTCHLARFKTMNPYTPYVFQLTPGQRKGLVRDVGFAPTYFEVEETYRGFNEAGPHWNVALRFSHDQIEVPLDLLLPDAEARKAVDAQGWKTTNPCFPKVGEH